MEIYKKVEVWKKDCGDNITKTLLDNIVELTNGKWYSVLCVNSRGESFKKYVIEVPNAGSSDVSGSDSSDS